MQVMQTTTNVFQ